MQRWSGRVALVTGASAGIGAAICTSLANSGMKVVGVARNQDAIEQLAKGLPAGAKGSILALKCDLSKKEDIDNVFETIKKKHGHIDLCVNNAGVAVYKPLLESSYEDFRSQMEVNVVALCYCSKLATQLMVEKGVKDGQIINISSVGGHATKTLSIGNFYCSTKHAVRFLTQGLRNEMIEKKYSIRVASISPGFVKTEFVQRASGGDEALMQVVANLPYLESDDIAKSVEYILSAPPEVEVNDIIIRTTGDIL